MSEPEKDEGDVSADSVMSASLDMGLDTQYVGDRGRAERPFSSSLGSRIRMFTH